MKPTHIRIAINLLVLALWNCPGPGVHAQNITQTLTLQPGWNAVWLEVQPENNRCSAVFSNLPVASVWTRFEPLSSVEFIQNPSEAAFNEAGWQHWLPASREAAFLNNLFTVQANHAYLIKCTNASPVIWNLLGRPSLREPEWVPDSFNLKGLPVDPTTPPTFVNFFRPSPAHFNSSNSQLQPIYRLNSASGQWDPVTPTDPVQSGIAYWIFTAGASDYLAPLSARVDLGDGLNFGVELKELNLSLHNHTPSTLNALIKDLGGNIDLLSYYKFDTALGGQWPNLPVPLPVPLAGGAESVSKFAPRRHNQMESTYESVLEVRDGLGTRLMVPVLIENPTVAASQGAPGQAAAISDPLAGLWVGSATLNAVSESHSTAPTVPTPTRSQLNLRLIVHVDALGKARLLKEVIQMWREGTYTNDPSGNLVVDKPGEYVLLTDDALIPFFGGSTVRDGQSVGRRISTVGYDFPSTHTNNFLELSGSFGTGQTINGTLTMPHGEPTNPFLHKYHPDHDDLNARFDGPVVESYTTTRQIALEFLTAPPDGPDVPDFGYNEMGGNYLETVTGIHKNPIYLSGTFRLSRVSLVNELNPNPAP